MIEKLTGWFLNAWDMVFDERPLTLIQLIGGIAKKTNEVVDKVNELSDEITAGNDLRVTIQDLEENRKLSATGDFTGTWHGLSPVQTDVGLSARVDQIDGELTTLQSDLQATNTDVTNVETSVGTLQTDVSGLQNDIDGLNTTITNMDTANTLGYIAIKHGLKGDGSDDLTALNALLTLIGNANADLIFTNGTYRISQSVVIPENIRVVFLQGAVIAPDVNKVVTINGSIQAPISQIFGGAGDIVVNHERVREGYAEWFGAISNDSTADCLPALTKAVKAFAITKLMRADYYTSNVWTIDTPHRTIEGTEEYAYDNGANKATRIIVKSATADVIKVGVTPKPVSMNDFLKHVTIKNLSVTRDRPLTPPVAGQEVATGCAGVRLQYTLHCILERVRSEESTFGFMFDGTVATTANLCYAFRSFAGNNAVNDSWWGYCLNGGSNIGAAGGNASTRLTDCSSTIGGTPALVSSTGFVLLGKPSDTFMFRCESSGCDKGIEVIGDTSTAGNLDVHILNPIMDTFKGDGILIRDIGDYGSVEVANGYFAPMGGSVTAFGIRVLNYTGMLTLVSNEVICFPNNLCIGMWLEASKGIKSIGNRILGATRPMVLRNISNSSIEDSINNPNETATQEAVSMDNTCIRNKIAPIVRGKAGAFPRGINMVGANHNYNEVNCTGIDPTSCTASVKLTINGVNIGATGLSGTNLVAGVMN